MQRQTSTANILPWLLWWKIDAAELRRQVEGYQSLGPLHAIRGVGLGMTLCVAAVSGALGFYAHEAGVMSPLNDAYSSLPPPASSWALCSTEAAQKRRWP